MSDGSIGRAVLELGTDDKKLDAGLAAVPGKVQKTGEAVKGIAGPLTQVNGLLETFGVGLSVGAVVAFGKSLLDMGDAVMKVHDRTGLATDDVQRLQFIAEQSGNSLDDLTGAVSKLQIRLADGSAKKGIEALGLNFEKIRNQSPYEQISNVADAMAKIENPTRRAQLAVEVFGKAGAEVLPTLVANFKELGDAAPVASESTIKALDDAGDAISKFGSTIKVWAAESYNYARRLFDDLIALTYRWISSAYQQVAKLVDLAAKLPGASKIGITPALAKSLKEDAVWFMNASLAMDANTTAAKKNAPAVAALPPIHAEASKEAKAHAKEIENLTERLSGAGAIKAAGDYREVLAKLPPIQRLTKDAQLLIAKAMEDAIAVYAAAGKSIPRDLQLIAMAARAASHTVNDAMKALIEEMQRAWQNTGGIKLSSIPVAFGFEDPTWATRQSLTATRSFVSVVSQIDTKAVGAAAAQRIKDAFGPNFWQQTFGSPAQFGIALGGAISAAIQGGGNVLNAAGGLIGQALGTSIGLKLGASLLKDGAGVFSKALGGMLQSILPGIGALVGPLASKLWGALFGTKGRDEVKDFAAEFETFNLDTMKKAGDGFDNLHKKLLALPDPAYGEKLWIALTQGVGKNNPEQAKAVIEMIRAALADTEKAVEAVGDAAGPAADAQAAAADAIKAKYTDAFKAIDDEYKKLQDSVAAEAEEAEMGVQERNDRARMAELEKQRAALEQQQQEEIDSKEKTYDVIVDAGKAARKDLETIFGGDTLKIPYEFVPTNAPGVNGPVPMAAGGYGRITRPTLFYSGGNEDFAFSGEGRSFGIGALATRPIVIDHTTTLDGRVVARNQIRHTPNALALAGVRSR